jgi:exosome complex component RRP42
MKEESNKHLLTALETNVRYDGRKKDEYRNIEIEYGVSATAEGSARVKLGDTEVIAGVKMAVETPYPDTPEQGNLMVDVHLLPLSSRDFESGPPGIDAIELARVTDRGIRESHCIDLKSFCIVKGEKVWSVSVDVSTLNVDGNLFDVASLAVLAAIKDTRIPSLDEDMNPNYKEKSDNVLALQKEPIGVTVYKIGDELVVDPTAAEEAQLDARLTVTTLKDGSICAMQKGGSTPLTADDVEAIIDLATAKAAELRKHL